METEDEGGLPDIEWRKVIRAIENSLPIYDSVSERISLNQGKHARKIAIESLSHHKQEWIVDVGVGPGISSRMLVANGFRQIIGIDPSRKLLHHVKRDLSKSAFHPVQAVSEWLPLRRGMVGAVLTCFALRDARNVESSFAEYSRIIRSKGRLSVVDIGKPDDWIRRSLVSFYIHLEMPMISWIFSHRFVGENPFRMIAPTFDHLLTNQVLARLAGQYFGSVRLEKLLLGGLIVLTADKLQ